MVRLPFKETNFNGEGLGHSRSSVVAQFYRNEARLMCTPDLKKEYDRVVREYCDLGHMRCIPHSNVSSGPSYYLPHHAVIKPESVSTKVRVVFNASSPTSTGLSLNDILHTAFHRFVSRRGCPLHLYSDNGSTFVGASKILARNFLQASRDGVTAYYALQGLTWHFIPPGAPHMGGLWEAGVKSFKAHFRKFAGSMKFTFEEFSTLLSRIEAWLNSRPLSPISQDPFDFAALTPGHFFIGTPILVPVDPQIDTSSTSILNRWEKLKAIHQTFCSRWKNEYLRELQKRNKWQTSEPNVTVDSLVAVIDDNLPPNAWRLGRISKVYLGSDERVRVADIVTQQGTITRPVTKLVVLSSQN
ncbi:uncharacterized protein LOC131803241 [Musca domestica]|uniref:Uncharacterized protein LOC131803241 n=1 Tax=Musca domestica TaxID=7370 RepID=A0ABM3V3G1_MUSDO|nr:uncharacterized protein LOC131803241 [Musca domestica]